MTGGQAHKTRNYISVALNSIAARLIPCAPNGSRGSTVTSLARSALWYARRGWQVFPLRPRTKEPFAGIGVYAATSDADQVMDWWSRWPLANIGLHCGGSGILALDLDAYKDTYQGGGFLAPADEQTVTNLTGSGGTHLLYAMPDGVHYTNATGNLPPGIDVRGQGGYIVVPPSIHPNGNAYRWEIGFGPHEYPLLMLPDALRNTLDDARAHRRTVGPPDSLAVRVAAALVESLLESLNIAADGPAVYDGGGRRWILRTCPFNPPEVPHAPDRSAFICVARDGHISAGCHHARCRERLKSAHKSGFKWLVAQREQAHA